LALLLFETMNFQLKKPSAILQRLLDSIGESGEPKENNVSEPKRLSLQKDAKHDGHRCV